MDEGFCFDPDSIRRAYGDDLPVAADLYDNAYERMAAIPTDGPPDPHACSAVDEAWRNALIGTGGIGVPAMLQRMQHEILNLAILLRSQLENYLAADREIQALCGQIIASMDLDGENVRLDGAIMNRFELEGPQVVVDVYGQPVAGEPLGGP